MSLKNVTEIHPGYLNRAKIRITDKGSHWLVQARGVESGFVRCASVPLIRFDPELSSRDFLLKDDDVVFMARGARNYAAVLTEVPQNVLAAASFFVLRPSTTDLDSVYLAWYLNQPRAQHYFTQNSGRGVHMPVVRRSVLEHMDIPLPSVATQKRIADVFRLMLEEQDLTTTLLSKRAMLTEAVCLQAAEREES